MKPNNEKVAFKFTPFKVIDQLRNSGIYGWVKLRKGAFAHRMDVNEFFKQFGYVCGGRIFGEFKHKTSLSEGKEKIQQIKIAMQGKFEDLELQVQTWKRGN